MAGDVLKDWAIGKSVDEATVWFHSYRDERIKAYGLLAKQHKEIFDSYIAAGFTPVQALHLTSTRVTVDFGPSKN